MMILHELRHDLKLNSDPVTKKSGLRFFKEEIQLYGVKTAAVHKISKKYFRQIEGKQKGDIFDLCEELLQSGIQEEAIVACNWSYYIRDRYEPEDFSIFERWVGRYVTNWASCDTLCNHSVGAFLDIYPEFVENLETWARSENRWMRRSSAVSLIIPAREGRFHKQCLEIAGILLQDENDLVQKGYGWLLKVVCEFNQNLIYDFVMENKTVMPRTDLRYAIEKMPEERRKQAMAK